MIAITLWVLMTYSSHNITEYSPLLADEESCLVLKKAHDEFARNGRGQNVCVAVKVLR
jgi:hypothetical protein